MYIGFELNDYQPLRKAHPVEIYAFKDQAKGTFDKLSDYMAGKFKGRYVRLPGRGKCVIPGND